MESSNKSSHIRPSVAKRSKGNSAVCLTKLPPCLTVMDSVDCVTHKIILSVTQTVNETR